MNAKKHKSRNTIESWEGEVNEYEEKKNFISDSMYLIFFLFVTFASLFYIVEEANHHCTGEACPVCANIHQAEQTLRNLSTGTIVHAAVNPILIMCVLVIADHVLFIARTSLVSQKVRLNN